MREGGPQRREQNWLAVHVDDLWRLRVGEIYHAAIGAELNPQALAADMSDGLHGQGLLADAEETRETPHPKLRIARSRPAEGGFLAEIGAWLAQPGPVGDEEVRRCLQQWVPEYRPADTRPGPRLVEGAGPTAQRAGA